MTLFVTIFGPPFAGVGATLWYGDGDGSRVLAISATGWLIGVALFNMGYV